MPRLEIALLGAPRLTLDGKAVETDRRKAIGLLAYLAVESGAHSRASLAALLWPDYPQASALAYLRRTLWELNQVLGEGWVEAGREDVTLARTPDLALDCARFQSALEEASAAPAALEAAIALYRGEFLEGLAIADTPTFEAWQRQQAEVYRRQFAALLERLSAAHEAAGAYALALPAARRWLALDSLNEAASRAVMRQLAGLGERSAAIHQYQATQQALQNELGAAPQAETTALYQSIVRGEFPAPQAPAVPPPASQPAPASPARPAPRVNLPVLPTPFIGRQPEIEQIAALALNPATHLLSLVGPGGAGKTRLSIQAAAAVAGSFPDGVWFIPLASVQTPQGIVTAAANSLSINFYREEERPRQQLLDFLREKHLLLVLDNFEHLASEGASLLADILATAPGVKLLVTSRLRLNLQGEQVVRVDGMRVPDLATAAAWSDPVEQSRPYSAVQLLLERARRVNPQFQLTRQNQASVVEICRLVEGSPLGIELAVTWLELLPPAEVAKEIGRSLDFLESASPDTPARQRSLRAVFETSWSLLDAAEQQAFRRLCIFTASFSRQAAQAVSGASLRTLLSLVNKSWLQPVENERYQLHELVRQYGMERLRADPAEWRQTKDAHAAFFCDFLQAQGQALRSAGQIQALQAIKAELESNIQAAWDWLVESGNFSSLVDQVLPGLFLYWIICNGSDEIILMLKRARQAAPVSGSREQLRQHVILESIETGFEINWAVYEDHPKERLERIWNEVKEYGLENELGFWYLFLVSLYGVTVSYEEAARCFRRLMPYDDPQRSAWERGFFWVIAYEYLEGESLESRQELISRALAIFQSIGVVHEQGVALRILSDLVGLQKNYALAIQYNETAQELFSQAGDFVGVINILINQAGYFILMGDLPRCFRTYEDLRRLNDKTGNRRLLGQILSWESMSLARFGSLENALEARLKSVEIAKEVGSQSDIAWHTWELGNVYRLMGDLGRAQEYFLEARPWFEKMGESYGQGFVLRGLGDLARARGDLAEALRMYRESLECIEREQRSFRVWGLIYAHTLIGGVLVQLGALDDARRHLYKALQCAQEWVRPDMKALALTGVAALLAAQGEPQAAAEIIACIDHQTVTWNETRQQARALLADLLPMLPPETARRAQARGREMDIDDLVRAYLDVLRTS